MTDALADARAELATAIARAAPADRADIVKNACIKSGGTLIVPGKTDWGPHDYAITLLGAHGIGPSFDAALDDWRAASRRMASHTAEDAA